MRQRIAACKVAAKLRSEGSVGAGVRVASDGGFAVGEIGANSWQNILLCKVAFVRTMTRSHRANMKKDANRESEQLGHEGLLFRCSIER